MKVLDPGHGYALTEYDGERFEEIQNVFFMKREGSGYPGNVGHHSGTNLQEVCRMVIDRVKHLDRQIKCRQNSNIIDRERANLYDLEFRAAERHGIRDLFQQIIADATVDIENIPTCRRCGHIACHGH